MAMIIVVAFFALIFVQVSPPARAEVEEVKKVSEDIFNNQKTFFERIDEEHLQKYIESLMDNVANSAIGEPQVAIDQRVDLEFLIEDSSAAFMVLKAMIAEIHHELIELADKYFEKTNIKRSELKLSTFLQPFEYTAHDFGFKRFVNKPKP